jgi:hypothetical protein
MTWAFAGSVALLGSSMKGVSLLCSRQPVCNRLFFILWPLASVDSLRRVAAVSGGAVRRTLTNSVLLVGAFLCVHWAYWRLVVALDLSGLWLSYLGAPLVWLMGESGGSIVRMFFLPTGKLIPLPHNRVLSARNLAAFWGRHWNIWFSDWFRQVIFWRWRARPVTAVVLVFLISGAMHEFVLNFNLWLITGHAPFGSMMLYFGVQALGILVEQKWFSKRALINRCFAWLVVLGPAPLIVNEGLLRALHLWR